MSSQSTSSRLLAKPIAKTLLGPASPVDLARTTRQTEHVYDFSGAATSFAAVEARKLGEHVCEQNRERAASKDVDIVFYCTSGAIWVQASAFQAALHELVDNAVRATKAGHSVLVEVRGTDEEDVLWQIRDQGEGIPAHVLADLGRGSPNADHGPRGVGIALAWSIIESHEGLLRFESILGHGTTASVWIPGRALPGA
jgi:signal transduction histidine kinase